MGRISLYQRITAGVKAGAKAFRSGSPLMDPFGEWVQFSQGTKAGVNINETSALSISALFAAINFIAGTMASLPRKIYRRLPGGGRETATDHPLYDRLANQPDPRQMMTAWQWTYTSLFHKYLWGNWYTYQETKTFREQYLVPLLPDRTWPDPNDRAWIVTHVSNGGGWQKIGLRRENVLHIPHISLDGKTGKGVIHYARESMGIAKAQDQFAAMFFGQGVNAGGFVEFPEGTTIDEETRERLQKDFNEKYAELGEAWKAIFLPNGLKFKPQERDAMKAQALESRQFSVVEVARWMNLPPHVLRELSRATFSNIEQQALELVIYSLLPIATQIEEAMNITLLDPEERRDHYVKFEMKGLLRGDLETRQKFYVAMLDRGVFNADDVLELEDMNPQPSGLGQVYMTPLNFVNKETLLSTSPAFPATEPLRSLPAPRTTIRLVERRGGQLRRKVTTSYLRQFRSYGAKVVGQEVKAVRAAVAKYLAKRTSADFLVWLEQFYRDFAAEVDKILAPLLSAYSRAILPIAQEEINNETDITGQYDGFERQYREGMVVRHVNSSTGQLRQIVEEADLTEENAADAIIQRVDEWDKTRPDKIVMRESIRAENAFTRAAFAFSGVSRIRSVAYGSETCPYCQALDGQVIGINDFFLTAGEYQPEGADRPLIVAGNRSHPPYHDGCLCGIEAEV